MMQSERASEDRGGRAAGVEVVEVALRGECGGGNEHADQEISHADAQERAHRIAETHLPLMQHRAVDAPRDSRAEREHNPDHRFLFSFFHHHFRES
jgi:hypothetical protein